ncbi:succinyl ligase [Fusarium subglutinans]|uniref:Succinyl ligase n=1 Tax=Gibberella subglutinans TaxID=42677 RepID=A0A8H5P9L7_GIBSU|nr:succinyl ligase [Fusarium subglutinans]KAF5592662.1 succinyl ligase [Fusarium subglutinans]
MQMLPKVHRAFADFQCRASASRYPPAPTRGFHSLKGNVQNLMVNETTRVIYQGFTGKTTKAINNARDAIAHGINIAAQAVRPNASLVHVPASFASGAVEEAIEAEIPLIVAIAEHIPVHDMLRVHEILRTQSKSRLVGPNTPGILAPGKCRIGIIPADQCAPGRVGIISRSGTMIYEAIGATLRAGQGQSLVVGLGGDSMPGTTMKEALEVLLHDSATEAIILIGEIGGSAEVEAAELLKPVISIISGRTAPPGRAMGHAGALLAAGELGADAKARVLQDSGARVLDHLGLLENELRAIFS